MYASWTHPLAIQSGSFRRAAILMVRINSEYIARLYFRQVFRREAASSLSLPCRAAGVIAV
jgi:hypothetical protein